MRDFEHPDSFDNQPYPKPDPPIKRVVVLGLGEIGRPIFEMLRDASPSQVFGKDIEDVEWKYHFKFMHVCIPQNPGFLPALRKYVEEYRPEYIIIHSTLSPGVSAYLDSLFLAPVYYSPVRGNIKDGMRRSLEKYTKYIAGDNVTQIETVIDHLEDAGFSIEFSPDPVALEWAKILDLAWYGLNIAFYQELERLSEEEQFDVGVVRDFIKTTPEESEGRAARTLFFGGYIGGHCVIQAIEKILAKKDIPMLREAIISNIKRQEELLFNKPDHHPTPRRRGE